MIWLCVSSKRSVWASFAPILRLNPTMSVNMIAASRRFSPDAALLVSSFIGTEYSADAASLSTVHDMRANAVGHPPRPKRNLTRLLQTAIGPRSGWSDSLANIALNEGQRFAPV